MVFRVEIALWPTAAKKASKWFRGVSKATARFMVKWHEDEAKMNKQRRASFMGGVQGDGGRGGNRRSGRKPDRGNESRGGKRRSRRETAVGKSRKEMADSVARHQADYYEVHSK